MISLPRKAGDNYAKKRPAGEISGCYFAPAKV